LRFSRKPFSHIVVLQARIQWVPQGSQEMDSAMPVYTLSPRFCSELPKTACRRPRKFPVNDLRIRAWIFERSLLLILSIISDKCRRGMVSAELLAQSRQVFRNAFRSAPGRVTR
jgi:hypothetical protein